MALGAQNITPVLITVCLEQKYCYEQVWLRLKISSNCHGMGSIACGGCR